MSDAELAQQKKDLRVRHSALRAALSEGEIEQRAAALADRIVAEAEARGPETVALYASVGSEPGTRAAVDRLHALGMTVLLPVVVFPELELDWAEFAPGELRDARRGLVEPSGPRLGLEGIARADVVFCPGLAATPDGRRLGQGGGCYDKALPRTRATAPRLMVMYDEGVVDDLPADERDQRVDVLLTPTRTIATTRGAA